VSALAINTTGQLNTAIGAGALLSNTTGNSNTADGVSALANNTTGQLNTAIGKDALFTNSSGTMNTAIGLGALYSNTGSNNVALGFGAGADLTADNNIDIGVQVRGLAGESNTIRIGDNLPINNAASACYIDGIFNQTSVTSLPVMVNGSNKLGTVTSSKRFKEDIKPMDKASEALFALEPVTFRYKKEIDPAGTSQFGLVAEEVEKVNSNLVVRDKEGKPYSVRYDQVNAMLLNEFLKEHKKVQQLEVAVTQQHNQFKATIAELKREIKSVVDRSKDQDEKIQKVTARVELDETGLRTVATK
jgi:endosialidase-like protein